MNEMEAYIDDLFPPDEHLSRVLESIRAKGMPEISVPSGYGRLLTLLVGLSGAKDVLEIGALGGYSGICLARGLPQGGTLTSLELLQDYADMAQVNLEAAGFGGRSHYIVGDAGASLEQLAAEGRRFDFFFIDADKGGYPRYLDYAIELARPGALIVADNTLLRGRVADSSRTGASVLAMRQFNERIASDPLLTSTLLPAYDGLAVVRVNTAEK